MNIKERTLPPEEYARLKGTELENVWPVFPPEARVTVVEDDGEIVACWSAFPIVHVEGLWVKPTHKNARVVRSMINHTFENARQMGARAVLTSAVDEKVEHLALRVGGVPLPGKHFVINITEDL